MFGSALLWAGGGLWFLVCFAFLSAALTISSPRRIFPLVGPLTRILMRIMGAPVCAS